MLVFEATFLVLAFANAFGYALVAARARNVVRNPQGDPHLQPHRRHAAGRRRHRHRGDALGQLRRGGACRWPMKDASRPDALRRRRRRRWRHYETALHELQCFIGDPVGSVERGDRDESRLRHGACAEGLSLRPLHRARGDGRRARLPRGGAATCRRRRASAAMSQRSAISPRDAGTRPAACWRTSRSTSRATRWRCRPATRSTSSPAIRACCATASRAPCRPGRRACPATTRCSACRPSAWRRSATMPRAEALGRRAIELEPRDGWAQHAVAHVMEMQSRQRDGIAWMRANPDGWPSDSFLQVHNWWHLALFHYELGEIDEVLALFDGPIYGERSTLALNMLDASALLWRLHLRGVDVGDRWAALAANWAPKAKRRQLRLQRRACDDGLRRRRARASRRATAARGAARGDGRQRRQCRLHPRGRPSGRRWRSRRSARATMPRRCGCCGRCAASPTASAAAMRSAT